MTKITKNFYWEEFTCHDGTPVPENLKCNTIILCTNLQVLRNRIGSMRVLSGYRTPTWNKKIGGAKASQHLKAAASDLVHPELTPKQLYAEIEKDIKEGTMQDGGLGLYPSFVHYDIGPVRRWKG